MKNILIDTSIWVEYFKGNQEAAGMIDKLPAGIAFITGPVITELIQGLKNKIEKDDFVMALKSIPLLEVTGQDWVDAGIFGSTLREKGITVPLPDLIIYTVAFNNSCSLWTADKHFPIIEEAIASGLEIFDPLRTKNYRKR